MIDLTPLEVRKKKGDFRRVVRGYDPTRVDDFLDLVADRLESLVRENSTLRERNKGLEEALEGFRERERAMNEALVSAQQLREDMRAQSARDAEVALREARMEADRLRSDAEREAQEVLASVRRIEAEQLRFVRSCRAVVERQLGELEREEERIHGRNRPGGVEEKAAPAEGDTAPDWLSSILGDENGQDV